MQDILLGKRRYPSKIAERFHLVGMNFGARQTLPIKRQPGVYMAQQPLDLALLKPREPLLRPSVHGVGSDVSRAAFHTAILRSFGPPGQPEGSSDPRTWLR